MKIFNRELNDWTLNVNTNLNVIYYCRKTKEDELVVACNSILNSESEIKDWIIFFYSLIRNPLIKFTGTSEEVKRYTDDFLIRMDSLKAFL